MGLVLATVTIAGDDKAKADLQKLEGSWDFVSIVIAGEKKDGAGAGGLEKAVIKGNKMTFFAGGKEIGNFKDLELRLDPKKTPRAADLLREGRETLPCIYEVSDDTFKLAMPLVPTNRKPGEALPRPESFDSAGKPVMVLTAKRAKS
jgi:uncharacterized protein (TIGR03067 family)